MDADIWLSYGDSGTRPLPQPDSTTRCCSWLSVFGRLKPGVTISKAEAEMAIIAKRISERHPDASRLSAVRVVPLREQIVRGQGVIFAALSGAVVFLLLIACANVANLLLSGAVDRRKEMQTRYALGATRWQVAQQLIGESLVLSLIGTAVGLLLAVWAQAALVKVFVARIPIIATASIDGSVLVFAAAITLLCGVVCGMAPLLHGRSDDWQRRWTTENAGSARLRSLLVISELSLSLILVAGAGLLVRTVIKLTEVDFGIRTQGVLAVSTDVNTEGLRERENKIQYLDELITRLATRPGVIGAAATTSLPTDSPNFDRITLEGRPYRTAADSPRIVQTAVTPDYFQLLGIPLTKGRGFTGHDTAGSTLVAVVSEAVAQRYWPGEDPVGKRIAIGSLDRFGCFRCQNSPGPEWVEVVGIAGDVRSGGLGSEVLPVVYYSYRQHSIYDPTILIRTNGDALALAPAVQNEIIALNKRVVITRTRRIEQAIADTASEPRLRASLVGVFAGLALLLGMLGVYGTASHSVTQRTREIGIRMALGARPDEIARLVLARVLRLSILGAGIGLLASLSLARTLASMLFGIQPLDPQTLVWSCGLLLSSAIVASYIPTRRAMRIEPAIALRRE
jgi:predicted permease